MRWPKFNKKSAKIAGGAFTAIVILLIVIFATPILSIDKVGFYSISYPTVDGWVGKIPSPAYGIQ
jgi:hypothetical protein